MTTTNQSRNNDRQATDLPEVKRRRHLENLLCTRKRVARLAAEHRSHRLDATELYLLQLQIEQVLSDSFPTAFEAHIASWAEEEAAAEHHPMVTAENCGLCEAISKHHSGGDFDAPLAA